MADSKRIDKIKKLMDNYNISEEKANYLIYTDDLYLTIDDLKIKYDNLDMGKLPEWLSEQELYDIIWKTIKQCQNYILLKYATAEDLYQELQLLVRIKSNKIKSFGYLKIMLKNYLLNMVATNNSNDTYVTFDLDEPIMYNDADDNMGTNADKIEYNRDNKFDDESIVEKIVDVSDSRLRLFLIVVGYLLCRINSLKFLYEDVINSSSETVVNNLKSIEQQIYRNEELSYKEGVNPKIERKRIINARTIINALELFIDDSGKRVKKVNPTTVLDDFRYYIKNTNLLKNS